MKSQQDYAEILNGRPWTSSGPPVGLYHPVFDRFLAYFEESTLGYRTASSADPDDLTPSVDDAFRFMRASSEFYKVKRSARVDESPPTGRVEAVLPALSRLLCTSLPQVINADGTGPDAWAAATTPAGDYVPLAVVEIKLELGIGGDAKTQAQQSYARICSLPEHDRVRLSSCSPCFLVEIAGPWITVLGAVYVQRVIVQRLAGPIYLSPQLLHPYSTIDIPLRLFCALRRALGDLRQYYGRLPHQMSSSRFFPSVRSYTLPSGVTVNLDYVVLLSPDDSRAIYLARQADGKEVVVKFSLTYNTRAHRLLADHGLAPELIYDGTEGLRYGGLLMIVMDYVKGGTTLSKFLHSSPHQDRLDAVIKSVKKAIALLHAENLVFGDLRTPNILVDDDDVKLIDYDWCGVHQVDRYPFIIGDAIEWANGVGPLAMMDKDHDLYMLDRLEANIRAGARPGVW
ncbi:hypothetical protein JOM56_015247 [Amanita muscaria]